MTDYARALQAAYQALGLEGGEDFDAVKAAFRRKVKDVHPDVAPSTPATLKRLQRLLSAYEVLRIHAPRVHTLVLTPEEARKGGLRTIKLSDRSAIVRLPPGVRTGDVYAPVGDSHWKVKIRVEDIMLDAEGELERLEEQRRAEAARIRAFKEQRAREAEQPGLLAAFCERFVKASPASRFASWIRKGSDAA